MNKIIVFDDCRVTLKMIVKCFCDKNFDITIVDSYKDFNFYLKTYKFDLCLIDENLSDDLSGIDIVSKLRDVYDMPYMLMTGQKDIKIMDRLSKVGFDSFILKPFDVQDLVARVSKCIELFSKRYKQELFTKKMNHEVKSGKELLTKLFAKKINLYDEYFFGWEGQDSFGLGGDFVFNQQIDEKRVLFCIGDVSGHGIRSSYIVSNFLNNLKRVSSRAEEHELVNIVNRSVEPLKLEDDFICMLIGILNMSSGAVEFMNLGMKDPLVFNRKTCRFRAVEAKGDVPIGWSDKAYTVASLESLELSSFESVILCTDGFYEKAFTNETLRNTDLLLFLKENVKYSTSPFLAKRLFYKFHEENSEHHDDSTVCTISRMTDSQKFFSFPFKMSALSSICSEVSSFVKGITHSRNMCAKVEVVLSEFLSNLFKYSDFKGSVDSIDILVDFSDTLRIYLIRPTPTNLIEFNSNEYSLPDSQSESGYGLSIIKALCHSVEEEIVGDRYVSAFAI